MYPFTRACREGSDVGDNYEHHEIRSINNIDRRRECAKQAVTTLVSLWLLGADLRVESQAGEDL